MRLAAALLAIPLAFGSPLAAQGVVYVRATAAPGGDGLSWATAFNDLYAALQLVSGSGGTFDQVWVAEGKYVPKNAPAISGNPRTRTFALPSVESALYGGFLGNEVSVDQRDPVLNPTILSGDFNGNDLPGFLNFSENAYHVVSSGHPHLHFDGFIVEGGNANGGSTVDDHGAGALFSFLSEYEVANCTFRHNTATKSGAGLHVGNLPPGLPGMHGEIVNCVFLENRSDSGTGAGLSLEDKGFPGEPSFVRDCRFEGNATVVGGPAAARFDSASFLTVEGCTFVDNHGWLRGAVLLAGRDNLVRRCAFEGNSGDVGGALSLGESSSYEGDNRIEGCLFRANTAMGEGGAILANSGGFTDVVNCTLTDNLSILGASIYALESIVNIHNSILWGNTATVGGDLDISHVHSNFILEHSVVEGGHAGISVLDIDPLLDTDGSLLAGSPCIDAGDSNEVDDALDVGGHPRRVDDPMTADTGVGGAPFPDLGAFEYQTLVASPSFLSTAQGGVQTLALDAGAGLGGQLYWVLGSLSGSSPGLPYGGTLIALNPDVYFSFCASHPNTPPLAGSLGSLQPNGTAGATFTLPAGLYPQLAGMTVVHAFVVVNLSTLGLFHSSNAVPLTFTP